MGTSYIGEYPPLKCRNTTEMNKMEKVIVDGEEFEFKERKIRVEVFCCCSEDYVGICCRGDE